jgi:hypothetical protein
MIRPGFYAMKRRLGGMKLTPREELLSRWNPCPGCKPHTIPEGRRKDILFDHYQDRPQKSWGVYWRSHPEEYNAMLLKADTDRSN